MSKRKKVILVVMFLAIIYGLYEVFLSSPSKTSLVDGGGELEELRNLVTAVIQNLTKENLSESDTYIIARAETEWGSDPFLKAELPKKSELPAYAGPLEQKVGFTYSGYLEMGDRRLAIINGIEYETGEELQFQGYIVERIEPLKVVIRGKEKQSAIIVPIKEEALLGNKL